VPSRDMKHHALCKFFHQHRDVIVNAEFTCRLFAMVSTRLSQLWMKTLPMRKLVAKSCGSAENPREIDEAPSILSRPHSISTTSITALYNL
jgi:hypothetical protein